jgi:hypothetical protein
VIPAVDIDMLLLPLKTLTICLARCARFSSWGDDKFGETSWAFAMEIEGLVGDRAGDTTIGGDMIRVLLGDEDFPSEDGECRFTVVLIDKVGATRTMLDFGMLKPAASVFCILSMIGETGEAGCACWRRCDHSAIWSKEGIEPAETDLRWPIRAGTSIEEDARF